MKPKQSAEALLKQILFGGALEDKLAGALVPFPELEWEGMNPLDQVVPEPGRNAHLKPRESEKSHFPKKSELVEERARGVLLHHFANHELLAIETMAFVLLKFPSADLEFRKGLFRTLQDEQKHLGMYCSRMKEFGVTFGDLPLNLFFWTTLQNVKTPLDFVTQMSLTFEQANLDFALEYAEFFRKDNLDLKTAELLQVVHDDEVRHVAHGLKWFKFWGSETINCEKEEFLAYQKLLPYPLTPRRARGNDLFSVASREKADLDSNFIEYVRIAGGSRGKVPNYYFFNPECEIEQLLPVLPESIRLKIAELAPLILWLAGEEDVVELKRRPSLLFLKEIHQLKGALPEIVSSVEATEKYVAFEELRPWGFGESAEKKFQILKSKIRKPPPFDLKLHREKLYSKSYWSEFLKNDLDLPADTAEVLIKSDQSTSGRGHLRVPRGYLSDPALLKKLEDRKAKGDLFLIEPFFDKVHDFSIQYEILADGRVKEFDPRFFVVDHHFQYQGSVFGRALKGTIYEQSSKLLDQEKLSIKAVHTKVIEHLKELHYVGPVGIDAFIYKDSRGMLKVRPVVEVNARYTMGRIAHEMERALIRSRGSGEGFFCFLNRAELITFSCRNFKELEEKLKVELGSKFLATTPSLSEHTWTFLITDYAQMNRFLLSKN